MNKKTLLVLILVLVVLAGAVTGVILIKKNQNRTAKRAEADSLAKDSFSIVSKDTIPPIDTHPASGDTAHSRPQAVQSGTAPKKEEPPVASDPISRAIATGRSTLVDFGRGTCVPCKKMAPILEELKQEYSGRAEVLVLDLDEYYELARKVGIKMIPTQIFYDTNGIEVARHIGFMEKDSIIAQFARMGVK